MIFDSNNRTQLKIVAPGRICLFGDHQDYLGLPVIACAIDRNITLIANPNSDKSFNITLPDIDSCRTFSIYEEFEDLIPRDYFASALRVVKRYGCIPTTGYNIHISGSIPINAGVSSSSALVVAWVHFLLRAFGSHHRITSPLIAKLAFEAEVTEHNEPGGKMDQYTSSLGNILYIETGDPFDHRILGYNLDGLILSDSGISKSTIDVLSNIKNMAIQSVQCVAQKIPEFNLKDVQINNMDQYINLIPRMLQPYFIAAVENHSITQEALVEFSKTELDPVKIGHLMSRHHEILRDILKITVPKIDTMIDAVMAAGALGAKIVGSGGGGCIAVLSSLEKKEYIVKTLQRVGATSSYSVSVSKGTHVLSYE